MSQEKVKAQNKAKIIELEERRKGMKFNIEQRFALLRMWPAEGEYFNMRNARIVKENLALDDKEQTIFASNTLLIPGGTTTDYRIVHEKTALKAIDVGEWLASHFRTILKKQFDERKIRDDCIELYDMFVGIPQG